MLSSYFGPAVEIRIILSGMFMYLLSFFFSSLSVSVSLSLSLSICLSVCVCLFQQYSMKFNLLSLFFLVVATYTILSFALSFNTACSLLDIVAESCFQLCRKGYQIHFNSLYISISSSCIVVVFASFCSPIIFVPLLVMNKPS